MRNWVLGGLAAGSLVMLLFYAGVIGLSGFFVPLVFMSVLTGGVPGALVGLTIGTVRRRDSVTRLPPHPQ